MDSELWMSANLKELITDLFQQREQFPVSEAAAS